METEEKIEKTSEVVMQVREEILIKVNEVEGEGKRRVEGLQKETNNKLEQIQTRVKENYSRSVSYTHLDVYKRQHIKCDGVTVAKDGTRVAEKKLYTTRETSYIPLYGRIK